MWLRETQIKEHYHKSFGVRFPTHIIWHLSQGTIWITFNFYITIWIFFKMINKILVVCFATKCTLVKLQFFSCTNYTSTQFHQIDAWLIYICFLFGLIDLQFKLSKKRTHYNVILFVFSMTLFICHLIFFLSRRTLRVVFEKLRLVFFSVEETNNQIKPVSQVLFTSWARHRNGFPFQYFNIPILDLFFISKQR